MSISEITLLGDEVLRKKSKEISYDMKDGLEKVIKDLIDTMRTQKGLGLAGPQINYPYQVFVVDRALLDIDEKPLVVINPKILYFEGETYMEEGCLSVPGLYEPVLRPNHIEIEFFDSEFKSQKIEAEDLFARVLLHEFDHLQGILFVDRLPMSIRKIVIARWRRQWNSP